MKPTPALPADLNELDWTKSSYSNGAGGMCVEVADLGDGVAVRDSKDPNTVLVFTTDEYRAFTDGIKDDELIF